MKIVYLTPRSSFRENLRSDTLWGLICWGIKTVFSEEALLEFLSHYKNENVFKLTSAFRFFKESDEVLLLFPKPILEPIDLNKYFLSENITEKKERAKVIKELKEYKKVKFISKESFEKFLTGEFNEESFFKSGEWKHKMPAFRREDVLHNQINRLTNTTEEGALFSTSELFVKKGGLFFLMEGTDEQLRLVSGALNYFSHVGFGGDSSIGKNHFDISIEDFQVKRADEPNALVTLSLYSPTQDELEAFKDRKNLNWYELESRKGKFGGQFIKSKNFWKKSLLMFKEGSVFPYIEKKAIGRNVEVLKYQENSNYSVLHFGFGFDLPIKIREKS